MRLVQRIRESENGRQGTRVPVCEQEEEEEKEKRERHSRLSFIHWRRRPRQTLFSTSTATGRNGDVVCRLLKAMGIILLLSLPLPLLRMRMKVMSGTHSHDKPSFSHARQQVPVSSCTWEQLVTAFPRPVSSSSSSIKQQRQQESSCWSLQDEIIRIPASRIRRGPDYDLTRLGSGYKGAVYRAVVQLSSSSSSHPTANHDDDNLCAVALKTDHCHDVWNYVMSFLLWRRRNDNVNDNTVVSCLHRNAMLIRPQSFLGAEYTGALVFYSLLHHPNNSSDKNNVQGVLPTWAVVVDEHPVRSWWPRRWWAGTPLLTDPTVVGAVMPLVARFTPLRRGDYRPLQNVTLRQTARTLLKAARGLAYVHSLGLVYQDIEEKNMAVDYEYEQAFVFDHTFLGFTNDSRASATRGSSSFCHENAFSTANRQISRVRGHDGLTSDTLRFRRVLLDQLRHSQQSDGVKETNETIVVKEWLRRLQHVNTMHGIVQLLQDFVSDDHR